VAIPKRVLERLVVGLACCAALAFLTDLPSSPRIRNQYAEAFVLAEVARFGVLWMLYSVMTSTALTFFDVARGVFEAVESHSEGIKSQIRSNIKKHGVDPLPPDDRDGSASPHP